jgi:hypothetical protein
MHIPRKICIYCQFITYVWCTTNISSVFKEIIFEEAIRIPRRQYPMYFQKAHF